MPRFFLLISPRAEAAYFQSVAEVAMTELSGISDVVNAEVVSFGDMRFVGVDAPNVRVVDLLRLSFVQGIFEDADGALRPLDQSADFALHPDFVWGEKYRGKTNETLTQLLVNLCLQHKPDAQTLLDPMCGRATTCLCAMRYGINATGIEQDTKVLPEIRRALKKWTKLHRQKHKLSEGWVQRANKRGEGQFLSFQTPEAAMQVIIGDTRKARDLMLRKRVDMIATDIPYGVQHVDGRDARNPLSLLQEAAPVWVNSLNPGGVMAISFNRNIPKRAPLETVFDDLPVTILDRPLAHRMSESIVRDILLLQKDA